ncbi:MAG: DUF2157 domain-containing protein, partial [Chloroflexota bacterium]
MTTDREFTERLTEEIASWRRDGLINAAQARAIMARYGLTWGELDDTRRQGRLAAVVTTLGAVLTGIGVILFVASNWGELGRAARLVLLLLALGVAYGLGFLADRRDHPRVGASLIFLGSLIFGANVFLVAQTYHVQAGSPWLLLFWAAGATATAYTAGSRPSMYLAVIAMLLWYVFQLVEWDALSRGAQTRAVSTAAILPL